MTTLTHAPGDGSRTLRPTEGPPGAAQTFWARLLLSVLGAVILFEVVWAFPVYLTLDPARSRSVIEPDYPAHHAILVGHIVTGVIALTTLFLQFLAPFRRAWPTWHRAVGWIYVSVGAVPTSVMGLLLLPPSSTPAGKLGLGLMAVLWATTSVLGLQRARQGRYREHRRLMLYSVAFATGTSWGRVAANVLEPGTVISSGVHTDIATWAGWVTTLLAVHLYLARTERRSTGPARASGRTQNRDATTNRIAVEV